MEVVIATTAAPNITTRVLVFLRAASCASKKFIGMVDVPGSYSD